MKKIYSVLFYFLIILGINNVKAQITSSVLSGKVTDDKGLTLPGVTITLLNTSTGTKYGAQTNADGRYSVQNVNPGGPYTVTASFVGFNKDERRDIMLSLGSSTFNFRLVENTTTLQEVKVKARAGLTKSGASTRINQGQINTLPTINRSLQDLTRLTPQSNNNSFQGTNYRYNNVTLDGAINNDAIGFSPSLGGQSNASGQVGSSTRTSPVSLDAIQDVQVYVAPYDIKIGNVLGGSINAVTRSGTNQVTGSVYGFGRGAFLVGPNNAPVVSGGDGSKLPSDFQDFQTGVRLGLPIIKNKLFYFTNVEIARRTDPVIAGAGTAGSAKILSLQDAKDISSALNGYTGLGAGTYGNTSIYSNSNKFFNRLDWNINDHNQFTLRNNTLTSKATNLERDQQNFRFGGIDYVSNNNSSSTVAELKSRISNNVSNSLLLGYSSVHDFRDPTSNPALPQIQINGRTPGTTIFLGTDREAAIFDLKQKTTEFTDNLTLTKGKNTFTFGTHNEFYNITYNFVNAWNGRVSFNSIDNYTGIYNSNPLTISPFTPSRVQTNYNYTNNNRDYILANPSAQFKVNLFSVYAQDEIQVSDKLKVTGAIRLDYADVPNKQPLSTKTTSARVDGNYGTTYTYTKPKDITNSYFNSVQVNPRMSFNYDVNGNQSVVLRGGTGTFTGRIPFAWLGYAFYNNGDTYGAYDKNKINSTTNPITPGTNPIQAPNNGGENFVNQQVPTVNTGANGPTQVDMVDNNFKMPQVWRSSLAVDIATDDQWKFTLEGIYTKVIRDLKFQQVNTKDSVAYYPYDTQKQQPIYVGQKINPSYTNAYLLSNTDQGYRYSVTAQVAKTFPFGLSGSVAYTYGHSKDVTNGIRNSMESNWQLNQALSPNNPGLANSNFDIRHRIVSNLNFKYDWDNSKKYTTNFTFFLSAQSGNPYTFGFSNGTSINNMGQQVSLAYIPSKGETVNFLTANSVTGETALQQAVKFDQYIDGNKYLSSRRGQYTERNAAFTPWNNSLDFRLTQDIKFGAGKHKQVITFTYDIVNLTNLINKNWGNYYFSANTFNSTSSIGLKPATTPTFANASTTNPTYTFQDPGVPYNVDLFASRWQMQFGLRYSF
jgi:hypothetical protein